MLASDILCLLMQPHSMCTLALANFVWNRPKDQQVLIGNSKINMKVDYISLPGSPDERSRTLYYDLYNYEETTDRYEFKVNIVRASGGINCQMRVWRDSLGEPQTVKMTHGQQHAAGLMEEFRMYRRSLKGHHHNSKRYTSFSGDIDRREEITLSCGVLNLKTHQPNYIRYDLKILNSLNDFKIVNPNREESKIIEFPQQQDQSDSEKSGGFWNPFKKSA